MQCEHSIQKKKISKLERWDMLFSEIQDVNRKHCENK